jgi:TonB family protein
MRTPPLFVIALICSVSATQIFAAPPPAPVITGPELLQVFIRPRPPEYPYEARVNGWSGKGIYRAFVTPEGKVSRVIILHSAGHSVMDDMVIRTAMHWRAKPGRPKEVDFPIIFVAPRRGSPGEF